MSEDNKELLTRYIRRVIVSKVIKAICTGSTPERADELRDLILTALREDGIYEAIDGWTVWRAEAELLVQHVSMHSRTSGAPYMASLGMMLTTFPLPDDLADQMRDRTRTEIRRSMEWERNFVAIASLARETGLMEDAHAYLTALGVESPPPLPTDWDVPDHFDFEEPA